MALSIPQMARMSRLLDEALSLDAAGRQVWLDSLSPEHRDLATVLREALLPKEAQALNVHVRMTLPKLGRAVDEANASAASGLKPGAHVGPYELIRLLGAGGMAEVWLARRADGALKREIALKLPMSNRLKAGLEARFVRERDILASLEHPHIARLYDAGVDPQGLPYLAMEYVQGAPLTDWSDARRLGIVGRLRLFLQVLEAVQYAHKKQVIHRDLKPSNIFVTEAGQVRLLDFGVAQLLETQEMDEPGVTSVHGRALTPDYASPELLRGDPVDARSDLYSLGVLLYELLTGTQPYRLKTAASIGALEHAIATIEVNKPSTRLEQEAATARNSTIEQLARRLRGDLDAIVLMALAKDSARRYPSALAVAEDLRRHLDGKVVQAQPARVVYRLRKFVLRNRVLLLVSAGALGAMVATVGYALYRESLAQVTVSANPFAVRSTPNATGSVAVFAPPAHSIAVLPFLDMSEKKDQEYFSDGLSEELIDLLTKVPGLRVPARTSSFYFKGKSTPLTEIAKALNVFSVLEGSVQRSGNAVRITTRLVRVDTGYDVWSQTYDRDMKDIFQVQDEIAGAVVQALKLQLLTKDFAADRTANLDAYTLFLQGRYLNARRSEASMREATQILQRAVTLDPSYAPAWAELAQSYFWLSVEVDAEPTRDMESARDAVQKALARNPTDAAAQYLLAMIKVTYQHDWKGAVAKMDAARRADPSLTIPLDLLYVSGCSSGPCHEQFIQDISRDIERDPLNAFFLTDRADAHYCAGELDAAESDIRRALDLSPSLVDGKLLLVFILIAKHKLGEVLSVSKSMPDSLFRRTALALSYQALARRAEADAALQDLLAKDFNDGPYQITEVFAARGNTSAALQWLHRDYDRRMFGIIDAKVDPLLKPLAREPSFIALMSEFAPQR